MTFREDANHTLDQDAAYNLNIIRKMALHILKLVDMGKNGISMKGKRYMLSLNFEKYFERLLSV